LRMRSASDIGEIMFVRSFHRRGAMSAKFRSEL
jgi:hypothetical protein